MLRSKSVDQSALVIAADEAILEAAAEARQVRQHQDLQLGNTGFDPLDETFVNGWSHAKTQTIKAERELFQAMFGDLPIVCITGFSSQRNVPGGTQSVMSGGANTGAASVNARGGGSDSEATVSAQDAGRLGCKAYVDLARGSAAKQHMRSVFDNYFKAQIGVDLDKADAVLLEDTASGLLTLINGEAYVGSMEKAQLQLRDAITPANAGKGKGMDPLRSGMLESAYTAEVGRD